MEQRHTEREKKENAIRKGVKSKQAVWEGGNVNFLVCVSIDPAGPDVWSQAIRRVCVERTSPLPPFPFVLDDIRSGLGFGEPPTKVPPPAPTQIFYTLLKRRIASRAPFG